MFIDDDADEFIIFEEVKPHLPFKVEISYVLGADSAIDMLKTYHPDIIFVDVNMPKINGFECIKKIRLLNELNQVPIVIFSNGVNADLKLKAEKSGANGCLKKLSNNKTMAANIQQLLESLLPLKINN